MPRGRSTSGDSLDLLLDTICNTFGGVVFIAVLVALLLQTRGELSSEHGDRPPSTDEVEALRQQLGTIRTQLNRLEKSTRSQQNLLDRLAPAELQGLLKRRDEAVAQRDRFRSQRGRLLDQAQDYRRELQTVETKLHAVQGELERTTRESEELQARLAEAQKPKERRVHLPIARRPRRKQGVGLILRYGRMYVWHRYGPQGTRLGLNTEEFTIVGETDKGLLTTPKPNAGTPLDGRPGNEAEIRQRLKRFAPDDWYVTLVVRPDSFEEFVFLRDVLIDLGYRYRLMPAADGTRVIDRGGRGARVQ